MTRMKLCGLTRAEDIEAVNELLPEYIGFVFARKSRRYVSPQKAAGWRPILLPDIKVVGVFADEKPGGIAEMLNDGIIDLAQLHGNEDAEYIRQLRRFTGRLSRDWLIQAFRIDDSEDIAGARDSIADYILLDSGSGGTGTTFDWNMVKGVDRPYFLAGGLNARNVGEAIDTLKPYAVDVSSGIETDGIKDKAKMAAFAAVVRRK